MRQYGVAARRVPEPCGLHRDLKRPEGDEGALLGGVRGPLQPHQPVHGRQVHSDLGRGVPGRDGARGSAGCRHLSRERFPAELLRIQGERL